MADFLLLLVVTAVAVISMRPEARRWLHLVGVGAAVVAVLLGATVLGLGPIPAGGELVGVGGILLTGTTRRWRVLGSVGAAMGAVVALSLGLWWIISGGRVDVATGMSMDPSQVAEIRESAILHWDFAVGILSGLASVTGWFFCSSRCGKSS